ncbi:MAG: alpha/beta hydrolase [Gammaproteobacteria bacterium]|jgi:acetyl esterase/lipase|nr:alpha/beta hydrolase [Gammaproteobacteria bacterium]HJP36967.1 alpha/beta hydrolase [Gammaproteobacteria bacterium]
MASTQAKAIKDLYGSWLAAMAANPDMPLEEMRALFEQWGNITGEPGGVDYIEEDCDGVPCLWAAPKGAKSDRVLVCTHGGGYVVGSMYTHRKVFGHLAKATGCRALILHYRRAPEDTHPAQVEDAVKVYGWLLEKGIKPEHIATTGDSAGGALCTSMLLAIRDQGLPVPAAGMPMSPYYDMEFKGESMTTNAEADCLVSREIAQAMADTFLGGASPQDPLANPLYADLAGLPPLYIQVGADETLLDDSLRFEAKAKEAGVEIKLDVFPEMQHVFQFMAGTAPEADDAIQQMAAWVRPKLGLA